MHFTDSLVMTTDGHSPYARLEARDPRYDARHDPMIGFDPRLEDEDGNAGNREPGDPPPGRRRPRGVAGEGQAGSARFCASGSSRRRSRRGDRRRRRETRRVGRSGICGVGIETRRVRERRRHPVRGREHVWADGGARRAGGRREKGQPGREQEPPADEGGGGGDDDDDDDDDDDEDEDEED